MVQLTITQNPEAEPSDHVLPVSYPKFTSMCQKGDLIFVGRYLVTGSEDSSLYVKVCGFNNCKISCVDRDYGFAVCPQVRLPLRWQVGLSVLL